MVAAKTMNLPARCWAAACDLPLWWRIALLLSGALAALPWLLRLYAWYWGVARGNSLFCDVLMPRVGG